MPACGARPQTSQWQNGSGVGKNSFGNSEWLLPDPPTGHGAHDYVFQLFALDSPLALRPGATRGDLLEAMQGHVIAAAVWLVAWACCTLLLQVRAGAQGPGAFTTNARQVGMDLALFGFALGSVYGFGRNLLPGFLGTGKPPRALPEIAFWLHNGGLLLLLSGRSRRQRDG